MGINFMTMQKFSAMSILEKNNGLTGSDDARHSLLVTTQLVSSLDLHFLH